MRTPSIRACTNGSPPRASATNLLQVTKGIRHDRHPGHSAQDDRRPGIHDRVNLAITDTKLYVEDEGTITLEIAFDQTVCQIMDFFEIYLTRMEMCKEAATLLGCRFRLLINGLEFLGKLPG